MWQDHVHGEFLTGHINYTDSLINRQNCLSREESCDGLLIHRSSFSGLVGWETAQRKLRLSDAESGVLPILVVSRAL